MKLNDLSGRKFGKLTVLERGEDYVSPSGKTTRVRWLCQCECGKTVLVHSNTLTTGGAQSCGCVRDKAASERFLNATYRHKVEKKYHTGDVVGAYTILEYTSPGLIKCRCNTCGSISEVNVSNLRKNSMCRECRTLLNTKPREDLTGGKFGRLTVISSTVVDGRSKWLCLCDCGNTTTVATSHLKDGHTKSCGCYMREQTSKANSVDLVGRRFGKLIVQRKLSGHKVPGGQVLSEYLCKCDCGAEVAVLSMNLVSGNTQSCGCIGNSLGEHQVQELFLSNGINFTKQHSFEDLRSTSGGGLLRFDFAIWNPDNSLNCLVEFNGEQHYYPDKYVSKFGKQQREETDELKREYCRKNNLKLFEIRFDDDIPARVNDIINLTTE